MTRGIRVIASNLVTMVSLPKTVVLALLTLTMSPGQTKRQVSDAEVRKVHSSAILIDSHNDVTSRTVDGFDIGEPSTDGHTDIPRMKAGGLGAQFFAVYVAGGYTEGNRSANRTLQMIDTVRHDIIARYPDTFEFVTTADGIEAARKKGKIGALMGIEGGHAIEDSLRLLRDYYALGIRYMTLTHSNNTNWADSSGDVARPAGKAPGLTDFGKQVVAEMNRLGMLVDISHVSDKTFWDALETSKAPIFASHSSCRAISNIPRNMTDEMIVAMAKKGGLIQINFGCDFLSQKSADASKGMRERMTAQLKATPNSEQMRKMFAEMRKDSVPATLEDVIAHIDHVVKIAGVDAVGIGSDYDGVGCVPTGLEDVSKYPAITKALLEKGYSAQDIRKILGGNLLRVMRAAEKVAATK
jgi:membrane dipeptidase